MDLSSSVRQLGSGRCMAETRASCPRAYRRFHRGGPGRRRRRGDLVFRWGPGRSLRRSGHAARMRCGPLRRTRRLPGRAPRSLSPTWRAVKQESPGCPRFNDLWRRRDKYRARGGRLRPGLVPAGSGGFWPASRVPESVGRIDNSVLRSVGMVSGKAAGQASDFGEGREGHRQEYSNT